MSQLTGHGIIRRPTRSVDDEGELYVRPAGLPYVFGFLVLVTALEAINEVFGIGGPSWLYQDWFHDGVVLVAAALVLARAAYERTTRGAWLAFGLAMLCWGLGDFGWSVAYGSQAVVPYPTFADALWLLWYPLMAVGITLLIKVHFPHFEAHRWMDGLAVTLLVLAAGFALVIQPVADQANQGTLATVVDFTYPVLDVLLMGAVLGVYGLLGWRPDRMWVLIGLGVLATAVADAVSAVQEARGLLGNGNYDFVWTLSALLLAGAAWVTVPSPEAHRQEVTGLRAVALLLVAQALAAAIQVYALFGNLAKSERIVTLAVLVVTSIQIFLTRPRPVTPPPGGSGRPPDGQERPHAAQAPPRRSAVQPGGSGSGTGSPTGD